MTPNNRSERAIVVLNMINEVGHKEGKFFEPATVDIIPYVQGELQYFRERMRPVIFCQSIEGEVSENDFGLKIIQALGPRTGEITIKHSRPNAFFMTNLAAILQELKVGNLTLVGTFSHTNVIMTAMAALDHGYSVVVPETCVCSPHPQDHIAALRLINRWLNG